MRLTKKQRAALREKFAGRCAYCGCELPARWCADHVEPIYRKMKSVTTDRGYRLVSTGEAHRPEFDTIDNLMPCCEPCNNHKGPLGLEQWRSALADSLNVLRRNYSTYRTAHRFGFVTERPAPITVVFHFEAMGGTKP